jgi:hypothetical protein
MAERTINKCTSCRTNLGEDQVLVTISNLVPSFLFGPVVVTVLLLIFGPSILNLLVRIVSSRLETIKLVMEMEEHKAP